MKQVINNRMNTESFGKKIEEIQLTIKDFSCYLFPDKITQFIQGKEIQRCRLSLRNVIISISNRNILRKKNSVNGSTKGQADDIHSRVICSSRHHCYQTSIISHAWSTSLLVGGTDTLMLHCLLCDTECSDRNCIRFNKLATWKPRKKLKRENLRQA